MCIVRVKNLFIRASVLVLLSFSASAQDITFANKNSSLGVNTNVGGGVVNWNVDGVDYLKNQWFYYRVEGGPESPIQAIDSTPTIVMSSPFVPSFRSLTLTYANSSVSIETSFKLIGNGAGSGLSKLGEDILFRNLSSTTNNYHFFQYSDFDLFGASGGQSVQFFQNSANGQYYKASQTDGIRTVTETINSTIVPIGHYEANLFNATLSSLTDGASTTLSDVGSAGIGDVTFAYQWDVTLAPGGVFQLSKLFEIAPEPSALSLLAVATLSMSVYRRRNRK